MKNINFKYIYLLCISVLFLVSCSSLLQIERQKDFSLRPVKIKQIVSINPSFKMLVINKKNGKSVKGNSYAELVQKERKFNQILVENAQKNGIVLQIIDTDDLQIEDAEFFDYLAPLRKEILQVNYLQDFKMINAAPSKERNAEIFYENAPKISTHYSHLAEVYGTPFFAIQGVYYETNDNQSGENGGNIPSNYLPNFVSDKETLYFTLIADVSKSEIVYREYRQVSSDASVTNLNSIIYDSFKIIAN